MSATYKFTTSITVSDEDAVYWMDYIRKEEYEKFPELRPSDYFIAAKRMFYVHKGHTKITDESGDEIGAIIGET